MRWERRIRSHCGTWLPFAAMRHHLEEAEAEVGSPAVMKKTEMFDG